MQLIRFLLSPLALLYGMGVEIRNFLFDKELLKSFAFTLPVISVGNLTVGGAGKTPMIEYLVKVLSPKYRLFVLSRGYLRKTKGFRIAAPEDSAETIGDEPYQIYRKCRERTGVAVGEDRALAITEIVANAPDTDVILLDDAFQHRKVRPLINILLTEFNRPFYRDHLMPAGNLREMRYHARRADMIIVTKCPSDLSRDYMNDIKKQIGKFSGDNTRIYFTGIKYLDLKPVFNGETEPNDNIFVFSGIANAQPFMDFLRQKYKVKDYRIFPDHYKFTPEVIRNKIIKQYEKMAYPGLTLVCTEKDAARLVNNRQLESAFKELPLYYLPVEVDFLESGDEFKNNIEEKIKAFLTQTEKVV